MNADYSKKALLLCLSVSLAAASEAKIHRSHAAKAAFQREAPCPTTGARRGRCPGYVIDHIKPLCAGGADAPTNMQWQTIAEAKLKDREERKECHAKHHAH